VLTLWLHGDSAVWAVASVREAATCYPSLPLSLQKLSASLPTVQPLRALVSPLPGLACHPN
jgi:hypothetical protein